MAQRKWKLLASCIPVILVSDSHLLGLYRDLHFIALLTSSSDGKRTGHYSLYSAQLLLSAKRLGGDFFADTLA